MPIGVLKIYLEFFQPDEKDTHAGLTWANRTACIKPLTLLKLLYCTTSIMQEIIFSKH